MLKHSFNRREIETQQREVIYPGHFISRNVNSALLTPEPNTFFSVVFILLPFPAENLPPVCRASLLPETTVLRRAPCGSAVTEMALQ